MNKGSVDHGSFNEAEVRAATRSRPECVHDKVRISAKP